MNPLHSTIPPSNTSHPSTPNGQVNGHVDGVNGVKGESSSSNLPIVKIEEPSGIPTASGSGTPAKREEGSEDEDGTEFGKGLNSRWEGYMQGQKRKWAAFGFEQGHMDGLESVALGHHMAMLQDQVDVLYPAPPTAFTSYTDAVERLLPYHIYQIHESELEGQEGNSGAEAKRKQREIRETTELDKRINKVHERFFALRRREGTHPSPLPPLVSLIQSSTHALRQEIAVVQSQYRTAKAQHDIVENARRERERQETISKAWAASVRDANEAKSRPSTATSSSSTINPPKPVTPVPTARPAIVHTPQAAQVPQPPQVSQTPIKTAAPPTPGTPTSSYADDSELLPRPRGRPKGRGRGGLREATLTHQAAAQASKPTPQTPPARSTTSSPAAAPVPKPAPATTNKPGTPTASTSESSSSTPTTPAPAQQSPVSITIPMKSVQSFVQMGLLTVPHDPNKKTPGTILRTTADRKNVVVSIALGLCSQQQLQGLAKVLGVTSKPGEAPATTSATAGAGGKPATK